MEHFNTASPAIASLTPAPRVETHWTRTLYVDFYSGPHPRTLRRVGIAFAAISFVVVVALTAFLEATVLAQVASPEDAAASVAACHVPPPKAKRA